MAALLFRAVEKFSSSRLIMNSRWLWNSHQRHKFLRAEASRDILKFIVSEMSFPGGLKRYFPPQMPFHQNTRNRCFTILFDGAYFFVSSYGRCRLK